MGDWKNLEQMHCAVCELAWTNPEFKKTTRPLVLSNGIIVGDETTPTYFHPNRQKVFCGAKCASDYYLQHNNSMS